MDKINDSKDIRNRYDVPLFFRYMIKDELQELNIHSKNNMVKIDFYQVDAYEPYPFYKPISKSISIKQNDDEASVGNV